MSEVKQEVKQFYDQVGWKLVGADVYQNARYEDLRPVSRQYIHECHLRVMRHLSPSGRFLLDAGSGPVQYPEYLEYSRDYQYRVCADISLTALQEARKRLGDRGLYVVADVANLPFKAEVFDGVVSLHTIHHLPEEEHLRAFRELYRVLAQGKKAVVVNGWSASRWVNYFEPLIRFANRLRHVFARLGWTVEESVDETNDAAGQRKAGRGKTGGTPKGTFTSKHDAEWVKRDVGHYMPVEILVWRSVTVRFMRALIHPRLGGRALLRWLYALEERYPRYFGEHGKYPLIVIQKPEEADSIP
jgi:ubiquinone/menaquinone biosynthesis C-methylase UbiE